MQAMDDTQLATPFEGQKFECFETLKNYLKVYGKQNNMKFWIRSSHTIGSASRKLPCKNYNSKLKYRSMKFACIYGGEKARQRGLGIRKCVSYRNLGCPCKITAVMDNDGNSVRLDLVNLDHNHGLMVNYGTQNRKDSSVDEDKAKISCEVTETTVEPPTTSIEHKTQPQHSTTKLVLLKTPSKVKMKDSEPLCTLPDVAETSVPVTICRLCLQTSEHLVPIFEGNIESTILSLKIMGCASIQISPDDGLPEYICKECEETLDVAYNFRIQCENSDTVLRETLVLKQEKQDTVLVGNIQFEDDTDADEDEEVLFDDAVQETSADGPESMPGVELNNHYYKCEICDEVLTTLSTIMLHVKCHKRLWLMCVVCSKLFTNTDSLYNVLSHVVPSCYMLPLEQTCSQVNHNITTCDVCDSWYQFMNDLKSVSIDQKQDNQESFLCTVCGKVMKSKVSFRSHKNSHEGLKPHICIECGRGFADKKNLQQHSDAVHLKKRNHECPICKKTFYAPNKMRSHLTVHYGLKPYTCNICKKSFRLKMNFNKHLKIHTNVRPHKCEKCNASFIDKNMLKRHSYVHGGVKPYCCDKCGHRFSVPFRLKKHLEKNLCGTDYSGVNDVREELITQDLEPADMTNMDVLDNNTLLTIWC